MLPDHNEAIEISVLFLKSLHHFLTYGQEGHWQSQSTASHSLSLTFTGPGSQRNFDLRTTGQDKSNPGGPLYHCLPNEESMKKDTVLDLSPVRVLLGL